MAPREVQPEDLVTANQSPENNRASAAKASEHNGVESKASRPDETAVAAASEGQDDNDDADNKSDKDDVADRFQEVLEAAKKEPLESVMEARQAARQALLYRIGNQSVEEERKRGTLASRTMQSVLHTALTSARIDDLETKLRKLEAEVRNLPPGQEFGGRKTQCPVFKPILKRSFADEFRTTEYIRSLPPAEKAVLEVLVAENYNEPGYDSASESDNEPQPGIKRRPTGTLRPEVGKDPKKWVPERLRIRSWSLVAHLERVCRESISTYRSIDIDLSETAPIVLLRPFKLLCKYETAIRDSVADVERKVKEAEEADDRDDEDSGKGSFSDMEFKWKDLLVDLKLLIEFLDVDLKPTFELRESIRAGTLTEIEYSDLWHLFDLGETVVARGKRDQAYRVVSLSRGRDPLIWIMEAERDRVPPIHGFVVDCCSLRFNGTDYVPNVHTFLIRRFLGRRPISSLDIYPMRLDPDANTLRASLLAQGQYYLEATRRPFYHRMHRGRTLDEPPQDLEGQVIVDIAMALNAEPEWVPTSSVNPDELTKNDLRETQMPPWCGHSLHSEGCCASDFIHKDLNMAAHQSHPFLRDYGGLSGARSADELDDDVLLLPNWVHGFILRLRKWATLKMDDLTEVPFDNDFNQLMISPNHKQTILALVETHEKSRGAPGMTTTTQSVGTSLDLVKGKGTGLIILLHGEPGVGKTSTAECVADKTKRPLFPITCGDIGETAMEVEAKLQHNFRLAHRWDSVLLLDEADVFLAKRNKTDLRRNAVTSVFLRSLDYYAGILFLTTNRVGGIDPAFKSRIHLSVYYPRLDLDTTISLYKAFLVRAKKEQAKSEMPETFKFRDKEILRFAKKHYRQMKKEGYSTWNGRQIRNAFQTAIALVEYEAAQLPPGADKPVLGKDHFDVVAKGSKQFDVYLMRTLQGADDEIALQDQWRDDHFELDAAAESEQSHRRGGGGTRGAVGDGRKGGSRAAAMMTMRREQSDSLGSEDDSDSESDSEDDTSDDSDTKNEVAAKGKNSKGKKGETKTSNAGNGADELDEYEEFLRFKAMKKAKGR